MRYTERGRVVVVERERDSGKEKTKRESGRN